MGQDSQCHLESRRKSLIRSMASAPLTSNTHFTCGCQSKLYLEVHQLFLNKGRGWDTSCNSPILPAQPGRQ